ncbi:MAG: uridine phosphorylase [Desulfobacterales bacterium]|nr:MAG: uridine phosphorylase [Desulfobacterales bacterium]
MSYPTWSDLNSPSIVSPHGSRRVQDLGPAALMVSAAADFEYIRSNFGTCTAMPFFNGHLLKYEDGIVVAGPYIGAPYGVMLLESLIAQGVTHVIILGWCGALTPALVPSDIVVPNQAICDEGTSRHYMAFQNDPPSTAPDVSFHRDLLQALQLKTDIPNGAIHIGPIWTTDAIYRETREKVDWYAGQGVLAVEMECSALFAVATFRHVSAAAVLVVSDSLAHESGEWQPGFGNKTFKHMRKMACCSAMEITRKLK